MAVQKLRETKDFIEESWTELKKVTWPSASETMTGSFAVLLTVGVMLGFLFVSDYVLAAILPELMGVSQPEVVQGGGS